MPAAVGTAGRLARDLSGKYESKILDCKTWTVSKEKWGRSQAAVD